MALRKAHLRVLLGQGVDTKTDERAVAMPRMLGLENAVFTAPGAIGKRRGYDALSTDVLGEASGYSGARALAVRGDELLLFTRTRCYSYVEGAGKWSDVGPVLSVSQSDRPIAKAQSIQTAGDYAAVSGVAVVAWEDSRGGVYWCVVEDNVGRIVRPIALASATGERPRCVRVGSKLALLWAEANLGQVKIIVVDPTEPHTYNSGRYPLVLIADIDEDQPGYDATWAQGIEAAIISWNAVTGVRTAVLDPSGVLGSPVTGWGGPVEITDHAGAVTVGPVVATERPYANGGGEVIWIAYATASEVYVGHYLCEEDTIIDEAGNNPISMSFGSGPVGSGADALAISPRSSVGLDVWIEDRADPVRASIITHKTVTSAGTVSATSSAFRGCCLASKAWTDHDGADSSTTERSFVNVVHPVPLFGVYLTLASDGIIVARTLPGVAGDPVANAHLPSVIDDGTSARVHRWVAGAKAQLDGINGDVFTEQGLRLVALGFDDANSHQTTQIGASLYLGGACPQVYDGQGWVEHGFHFGCDWLTSETLHLQTPTGDLTSEATYSWIFVPEYTLANGEIVLGPPSKPYEVTLTAGNNRVEFLVPSINLTRMTTHTWLGGQARAEVRIGVYRSLAGDASVYYRCSSLDPTSSGDNAYVANVPDADSMAFYDSMSDETLATKEPLYTNGGIVENDPVPGSGVLVGGKGRLFSTDPSDGNVVLFSQERSDGRAMEMPEGLRIRVDDVGGAITALGVLDDALVIFKRSAIYYVAGPGPNAALTDGGFTAPVQITGEVGCTAAKSIVAMRDGLMFKSAKGIYLLDRARQVHYLGAFVEGYNDQDITRATLVDDTTQVRFLTDDGSTLLYDYQAGQWSTFSNHEGLDAVVVGGVYYYLRTDGRVFAQSADYDDAGLRIPLVAETSWIRFHEHIQGMQRVWWIFVIGERLSAHTLRVQYRLDYGQSWSEPARFDATDPGGTVYGEGTYGAGTYGGSGPTLYQFRVHVGRACQAIQVRITDHEAAGVAGAAATLTEILIVGGVQGPQPRMPAARSG